VAAHFAGLVAYSRAFGVLPLGGFAPSLSSLAFLLALLALGVQWITREGSIALIAGPILILVMVVALGRGFGPVPTVPAHEGAWFLLHIAASLLGLALMCVAFAAAALYLVQHRALKQRRFGVAFQFLPPLEHLDRLNQLALLLGFPTLTLGVLLTVGYLGDSTTSSDARLAHLGWGLLSWVVLGAIAAQRLRGALTGRRAARASVLGFSAIAATYFLLVTLAGAGSRFL
jgi:HemX protein